VEIGPGMNGMVYLVRGRKRERESHTRSMRDERKRSQK